MLPSQPSKVGSNMRDELLSLKCWSVCDVQLGDFNQIAS